MGDNWLMNPASVSFFCFRFSLRGDLFIGFDRTVGCNLSPMDLKKMASRALTWKLSLILLWGIVVSVISGGLSGL
jgi:hypothetical protein